MFWLCFSDAWARGSFVSSSLTFGWLVFLSFFHYFFFLNMYKCHPDSHGILLFSFFFRIYQKTSTVLYTCIHIPTIISLSLSVLFGFLVVIFLLYPFLSLIYAHEFVLCFHLPVEMVWIHFGSFFSFSFAWFCVLAYCRWLLCGMLF